MSDQSEAQLRVRLPKLDLPNFTEKYDEWFPFFDTFNSVIHSNTSISNIQKLQYLRASVTGDASNITSFLEISELNYKVAWNLLKERYENRRVIVNTHIKAIMDLPTMAKENSCELRKIADEAIKHIQALQALRRPTSHWDDLLVHILAAKLDTFTMREWQSSIVGTDPPTFKQFSEFVTHRCEILESTSKSNKQAQPQAKRQASCVATVKPKCNYCNGEHPMYYCKDFLALSVSQRTSEVRNRKVCVNCLRPSTHAPSKCTSRGCRICKAKHNTLLHATDSKPEPSAKDSGDNKETSAAGSSTALVTHASNSSDREHIMLSTAVVDVFNTQGIATRCRILLDCGSQANFITREYMNALRLQPRSLDVSISGINETITKSTQAVRVKLQSRFNSFTATIECIVTDQITGKLPEFTIKRDAYNLPRNVKLADPQFNVSSKIDILIGAELFWDLLCVGQVKSSIEHPTLQKTQLGWILAGRLGNSSKSTQRIQSLHASITNTQLHELLSHFWQLEDVGNISSHTLEEAYCIKHFADNVSQTPEGRYIVELPIKESLIPKLGNSRDIALKRLIQLERRFRRDPELKAQYVNFMSKYLRLGHMKRVDPQPDEEAIYLPHHCVFKNSKQSSKIRVVFDASCKDSAGISLNDILRVGPVMQQDLMSIVMRFRIFAYVLVADIIKMYRQVLVHPSQTHMQRILWRPDPASIIEIYDLLTITYG
ncbi:uncharacterized protein [Temnothorax longispinosus]|uniref:uncharacterized protein n=1 Tax=Temnothorax longispinosus TaxID=300112 RepID=UPI003A9960CB